MRSALTFIIPVAHPVNVADWSLRMRYLSQTVASVAAQRSDAWNAVVVSNHGVVLPSLPSKFSVKWVDFPPNPLYEQGSADEEVFRDAVRIDKGRRILAGLLSVEATGHIMLVDDDDFVHRDLTPFVEQNPGKNGWYFSNGYFWESGGWFLYLCSGFSRICGTSHIVRSDLYRIPSTMEAASDNYVRQMFGSHIMIEGILEGNGTALEPLPFPGAIYRVGHTGSHSRSQGLFRQLLRLRDPFQVLRWIARVRLKTASLDRDFFGASVA